ncbi:MAG: hypothetical protein Q9191_008239 [Dirinaria sp. TL-2023a]
MACSSSCGIPGSVPGGIPEDSAIEEREVLSSIFPDEITATVLLTVSYPPSYPDTAPDLDISLPPNALPVPHLSVSADKQQLLSSLEPSISESLGMAMIFTLVSTLKDSIEQLIVKRQSALQAAKDAEAQKAEEAENAKFHGEAVTKESFLKWRERFRAELEERRLQEEKEREAEVGKKKGAKVEEKLTGKQLWERGMVGKVDEEEDLGEVDGLESLRVTE